MRLPAESKKQRDNEDSREFCERLYQAFLDKKRVVVVVAPWNWFDEQRRISGATRPFWHRRGYRLRTQTNREKTQLFVWLELGVVTRKPRPAWQGNEEVA